MDFESSRISFQPFRKNMNFLIFFVLWIRIRIHYPNWSRNDYRDDSGSTVLATQHSSEFLCLCILLFYSRHPSLLFVLYRTFHLDPSDLPPPDRSPPLSCHSANFYSFFYIRKVVGNGKVDTGTALTSKSQCFGSWSGGSVIKWLSWLLSGSESILPFIKNSKEFQKKFSTLYNISCFNTCLTTYSRSQVKCPK